MVYFYFTFGHVFACLLYFRLLLCKLCLLLLSLKVLLFSNPVREQPFLITALGSYICGDNKRIDDSVVKVVFQHSSVSDAYYYHKIYLKEAVRVSGSLCFESQLGGFPPISADLRASKRQNDVGTRNQSISCTSLVQQCS